METVETEVSDFIDQLSPSSTTIIDRSVTDTFGTPTTRETILRSQEKTRARLAYIFAGSYVISTFIVLVGNIVGAIDKASMQAITSSLLPPMGALVGSIIGFYFASNNTK